MWPGKDSGFEADPFSPAGSAGRVWAFSRGMRRFRFGRPVVWVILAILVLLPIISSVVALLRRH